jgi:DNA adenine methylase
MATPFLKWAGGKRQLMDEIMSLLPDDFSEFETYVEPFLGGGSVLINILERGFQGKVVAGDINKDIILCYRMIKQKHSALISELEAIQKEIPDDMDERKEFYKTIRDEWNVGVHQSIESSPKKQIRRAALTISLNKMCFNGLFRLNSKGEFNVPMGGNLKVTIYSEENISQLNLLFMNVEFICGDYQTILDSVDNDKRCFFYFDPPYRRLKETSSLTMYNADPFDDNEQIRLRDFVDSLVLSGHDFLLSNSDPKNVDQDDVFFDEAYEKYHIKRVLARRSINSKADGRGKIFELLIHSSEKI